MPHLIKPSSMSPANLNQDGDETKPWTRDKWVAMICLVILVSFGIKLQYWTAQHDTYHSLFIVILSLLGTLWLTFMWIDLHRIKLRLNHSLDNPSSVTQTEWTFYTYLKAPHSYCFYLKVGLTILCFIHLILTTTLIVQEVHYLNNRSHCFDALRLLSSVIDLVTSVLQLLFIRNHSNIVINRYIKSSHFGSMILIAVGLLKWYMTIAVEAEFTYLDRQSELYEHDRDQSYQDCPTGTLYSLNISNLLLFTDPFTIEFNFLLAIQWLIIWQHIGYYKETQPSDYWSIVEHHNTNDEINVLDESIMFHKSGRGLFVGVFCFLGALISLIYYFSGISDLGLSESVTYLTKWEDLVYLTSSLLALLIASLQLSRLGKSIQSCIGSTDLILLFVPLIAFFIRGYIRISDVYSDEFDLIDKPVEILGIVQPLLQAVFIYFAKSKICDTNYLSQHKPGRQLITLLIALNLVIWVSGAFRAKAKLQSHNSKHIVHSNFLDVCQPFILFYRYHASVCLANIWKIVYS